MSSFLYCSLRIFALLSVLFVLLAFITTSQAQPQAQADLSVSKSGPATAAPDTAGTYQIIVANSGPDATPRWLITSLPIFFRLSQCAKWMVLHHAGSRQCGTNQMRQFQFVCNR